MKIRFMKVNCEFLIEKVIFLFIKYIEIFRGFGGCYVISFSIDIYFLL